MEPTIYKQTGIYKQGETGIKTVISEFSENKIYYGGAIVKKKGKLYLYNTNKVISGTFDNDDWIQIKEDEINKFYEFGTMETDSTEYNYCKFSYNPFLKIFIANINIKFTSPIQQNFDMNNLQIRFSKKFIGYGSNSGFSITSGGIPNPIGGEQICVQLFRPIEGYSGCSFWTNGVSNVYGMSTNQVIGYIETENNA